MWTFFKEKNVKIIKQAHACKSYASTYDAEVLNYFNSELQLRDTEYTIHNKLRKTLTESKRIYICYNNTFSAYKDRKWR